VTARHKSGKEAQPCAPARRWAFSFLLRKDGGQCRGWLGVLVVAEKHRVRIVVQLGRAREGQ
jgi:hypothetical protein